MRTRILFIAVICGVIFIAPEGVFAKRKRQYDCTKKITRAVARYKKRRYNEVKTILDEVKINCNGHAAMDTALYFLSKAYLATKQPVQASLELEVLVQDYPKSPFKEEAHFLLGICSYQESNSYERDQVETREAIRKFEDFIELFPKSHFADSAAKYRDKCREKLVKKEVMNARFYEKIEQYDAAIVYYKIIIDNFPQSSYIPESQLSLARNLVKVSRPSEAEGILQDLLASDADGEVKKKARLLLSRIGKPVGTKRQDTPSDTVNTEKTPL